MPPTAARSAAGFSANGAQQSAVAAQGVEELGRSGVGVGESGVSYATGDAQAAASYLTARGL
ncbi:PE domain-containing protein [Mycolicibacterium smegmatis]|uniref:PE domain-containing protein n=1 Tax=Mycolicibacterium smegmatis TaxID=1772 RepID=UPI001D15E060|nr:PE domain-containing protein [Mycolicibacterium smegmatis]MCC3334964.1 PE domain-containing protein [Mycolicibacterium smegmatis]